MADSTMHPLEEILRRCAEVMPNPWYPVAYIKASGASREILDKQLDELRLAGLIRLTDWTPELGQGYVLTPEGQALINEPNLRTKLRPQVPAANKSNNLPQLSRQVDTAFWDRGQAARAALLNRSIPWVTFGLIFANILWFMSGLAIAQREHLPVNDFLWNGTLDLLHRTGSLRGADIAFHHQWWRLLTCCFVHIGVIHLAVNMYSLYAVGQLLEQLWGSWRFLILYLIAGVTGSCGMLVENPTGGGAGASGALWGIMGSMATWMWLYRKVLPPALLSFWRNQLLAVFVINVLLTFSIPQISKGAHFGGAVAGLIAAIPLDYLQFGRPSRRALAVLGLVAIPIVGLGLANNSIARSAPAIRFSESEREFRQFQKNTFPELDVKLRNSSDFLQTGVQLLRARQPALREKKVVEKALAVIEENHRQLVMVKNLLDQSGPFVGPHEEARKLTRKCVQELQDLFALLETRLKNQENWTTEDEELYALRVQCVARIPTYWR